MKRDFNLVNKLLLFVETKGSRLFKGGIPIEGYERDDVMHHLYLVVDAGFVELGAETLANKGPLVLTWKGYDYLDELRAKGDGGRSQEQASNPEPPRQDLAEIQTADSGEEISET